jgi:hypothetical protein
LVDLEEVVVKLTASQKRQAKKYADRKKKRAEEAQEEHQDVAGGGFVPIACRNAQFKDIAVGGDERSCLPGTIVIAMKEEGFTVDPSDAYDAMPFELEDPTVLEANVFVRTYGMELQPQSDLRANPHQLFLRSEGTYVLETEFSIDGAKEKHFAVYCSKREWKKYSKRGTGVLLDNGDAGHDFIGIEAADRVDFSASLRAFKSKWPGTDRVLLVNAYRLVHIGA